MKLAENVREFIMRQPITLAVSAFSVLAGAGAASAADEIRVLTPTWLGFAPLYIAQDLGCFEENDLAVSMTFEDDLTNKLAAMTRGDIEVLMRSVGEGVVAQSCGGWSRRGSWPL
ncbi:hypothetical protein, partial [Rubellimicrobium roseum]